MTMEQANKSDVLYRTRWQALLSVDDLVADVVSAVERAAAANGRKGYVIFSSDHGYRFGQFRMPQGKWNVYENDISIPWLIMGPGVAPGSTFSHIASQVDTMPTILGLAGVDTPSTMDGRSLAPLLLSAALDEAPSTARAHVARERAVGRGTRAAWRTEQLIEYYGLGPVIRYEHMEDNPNNTFRALRVYDEAQPAGRRNVKLVQFTGQENWNFSAAVATYPYEWELFDIDRDPSETTNLYAAADKTWLAALFASLEKLYACQGATCN
jgi:N-acetylglucosamine-6-sulfatase